MQQGDFHYSVHICNFTTAQEVTFTQTPKTQVVSLDNVYSYWHGLSQNLFAFLMFMMNQLRMPLLVHGHLSSQLPGPRTSGSTLSIVSPIPGRADPFLASHCYGTTPI